MASNVRGKYTLRGRVPKDDYLDIETELDSEIDASSDEEDDEPLDAFILAADDENLSESDDAVDIDVENQQPTTSKNNDVVNSQLISNPIQQVDPKNRQNNQPNGWDDNSWKLGDTDLT